MQKNDASFTPIFDGKTLTGWHFVPRLPVPRAPGEPGPDPTTGERNNYLNSSARFSDHKAAINRDFFYIRSLLFNFCD